MSEIIIPLVEAVAVIVFICLMIKMLPQKEQPQIQQNKQHSSGDDSKPHFKPLTAEQIENIHSRGKITPAEKVKEWEGLGLCAPGDAIGSAAWRCRKFKHCCHDCLVDYANEHDEHTSFHQIIKEVHHQMPKDN